jgi:hypothetical protein
VIAAHLLIGQRIVANRVVQIRSTAQLLTLRRVLRILLDVHFPKPKAGAFTIPTACKEERDSFFRTMVAAYPPLSGY